MKKIRLIVSMLVFVIVFLTGCGNGTENKSSVKESKKPEEIRVVSIVPPFFSILLTTEKAGDFLVGVSPTTFANASQEVVEKVYPQAKNIDTSFMDGKFNINAESLLSLNPSIVFYYGDAQKKGLENVSVKMEDVFIKEMDNEKLTVQWEKIMADTLDMEYKGKMEKAWAKTHEKIKELDSEEKKEIRALYIFANIMGEIKVAGPGSHGDYYLKNVGIKNVAADSDAQPKDVAGDFPVSMEQINEWNPDVVYVLFGTPASDLLENKVPGQDWSYINAFKDKKIFQIPKGVFSWGVPCSESPLMPLWLMHTLDATKYSESDLKAEVIGYYENMYGVKIDESLVNTMLQSKMDKAKK